MKYNGEVTEGIFISRPNRFIANVLVEGKETVCHVKNTGRCKELLVPGCTVILERAATEGRRTGYDLVAVWKERKSGKLLVNMDSQAPNRAVGEYLEEGRLFPPGTLVRAESTWGSSRFDFSLLTPDGKMSYLEVKGCTLENDGTASFPDAPTLRGVKHIRELTRAREEGFGAYIFILVQMEGMKLFVPNWRTHPEFGLALRDAVEKGVTLIVREAVVTRDGMEVSENSVPFSLSLPDFLSEVQ